MVVRAILTVLGILSLLVPLVLLIGLDGAALGPVTMGLLAVGLAVAGAKLADRAGPEMYAPLPAWAPEPPLLVWLSRVVLGLAVLAFAWKVLAMPLWSWDHFAIWGVKARRMISGSHLDLAFLRTLELHDSRPDYPLGLPLLWRVLALGAMPSLLGIQLIHLTCGLALLALVRGGVRCAWTRTSEPSAGGRESAGNALAAWAAALPLYWDSEAVGLAEMPLALWLVAAAVLLSRPLAGSRARAVALGLLLGFLPWLKDEGLPLALLLAGAAWWLQPRGERRSFMTHLAAAALPLVAAAQLVAAGELAGGVGFFAWKPLDRLAERLPQAGVILGDVLRRLVIPESLGFWVIFAAFFAWAVVRRHRPALALGGVVLLQLGLYVATAFFTYLPPLDHLNAAFTRITAALMPLGLLAIGVSLVDRGGTSR